MGLNGVPEAGDKIVTCTNEREAKERAEEEIERKKNESLNVERKTSLEDIFSMLDKAEKPELKIVLKTDVRGSLEAITENIAKIKNDKITANIIHSGVGEISENDIVLAAASKAIIITKGTSGGLCFKL